VTGGASPGYYDLSDTPEFAPGLDILSGTATQQLPTPGDPIEIESGDVFAGVWRSQPTRCTPGR
jgi:hypothetical protein